jgi:ribonuclease HI
MIPQMLFTDGSVDTKTKIGFGAYLFINENIDNTEPKRLEVKTKQFENTSSTKLELQTLLWALNDIDFSNNPILIYTDSQNIIGLLERRKRLEQNNFSSKKNSLIKNHQLYKEFYQIIDKLNLTFVKVEGHKTSKQKDKIDRLFTLVDKASRNALSNKNK